MGHVAQGKPLDLMDILDFKTAEIEGKNYSRGSGAEFVTVRPRKVGGESQRRRNRTTLFF